MPREAVFLDRDGTLIDEVHYVPLEQVRAGSARQRQTSGPRWNELGVDGGGRDESAAVAPGRGSFTECRASDEVTPSVARLLDERRRAGGRRAPLCRTTHRRPCEIYRVVRVPSQHEAGMLSRMDRATSTGSTCRQVVDDRGQAVRRRCRAA
jgi:hypothetical protein